MSDNYRARVSTIGTCLYKNSRMNEDLTNEQKHVTIQHYIYIPNINNIDLNQFRACYAANDTNHERPFYVRLQRPENYTAYPYPSNLIANTEKLDFGDNKITFFSLDNSENLVGLKDIKANPTQEYNSIPFSPDMYSLASPFIRSSSYGVADAYFYTYVPDLQKSDSFYFGGYELLKKAVTGNNIEGLKPSKNENLDCVIIPYNIEFFSDQLGFNIFSDDEETGDRYAFGFQQAQGSVPSTFKSFSTPYGNSISTVGMDVFNLRYKSSSTGAFLNRTMYNMCTSPNSISNDDGWTYYTMSTGYYGSLISYAFLCDDNGDIWILTISQAGIHQNGTDEYYPGESVNFCVLTKLNDLPSERASNNSTNQYGYPNLIIPSSDDSNEAIKKLIKLETYGYDDGGPDIVGPGDPYGEIDNVDQVVGGKDINVDKEIDNIDTSPNTDYDKFALATGYFGSYVLETQDLERYTKTLSELYAHSDGLLAGEIYQQHAGRLKDSVTSLIMLPFEVPQTDYSTTVFAMGNVGVMGDGNWNDYVLGVNYANAKYLKKFTKIFNVDLGTIGHTYDNFLDFAPYTSASLYIPYVGKVDLPINLIQSSTDDPRPLNLQFRINYTSGDFVAILVCKINGKDVPISHWNGNCARPVKIAINDDSEAIRAGANRIISTLSAGISFGGLATASSAPVGTNLNTWQNVDPQRYKQKSSSYSSQNISMHSPSFPSTLSTSQHMIGSGSVDGELGFLGVQKIILTVERPIWWRPYDYGDLIGYPTKKIAKLSSVHGFAKVSDIHVRCSATDEEKEEISKILSEGAIF